MKHSLCEVKNLKIVPENYESATITEIEEIVDNIVKINLPIAKESELIDYKQGDKIEIFGLDKHGLIYFVSKILNVNNNKIEIEYPEKIKEIQRRKYTRVPFDGKLTIKNVEAVIAPEDISAGGFKFSSDTPFMVGNEYEIKIELVNNLVVDCTMQPIRVEETDNGEELPYSISAKFKKIRSIDRIALMQYSLRLVSESENKA